jgi:hypothetical protein
MAGSLSSTLPWELASSQWPSVLNPLLANPLIHGHFLKDIRVSTGANVIDHKLGVRLQGYIVTLNSAAVTFYDSQATNQMPHLTLILNASGSATISLYVF